MNLRTFAVATSGLLLIKNVQAAFPPQVPHPRGGTWIRTVDINNTNISLDALLHEAENYSDLIQGYETEIAELERKRDSKDPRDYSAGAEQRLAEIIEECIVLGTDKAILDDRINAMTGSVGPAPPKVPVAPVVLVNTTSTQLNAHIGKITLTDCTSDEYRENADGSFSTPINSDTQPDCPKPRSTVEIPEKCVLWSSLDKPCVNLLQSTSVGPLDESSKKNFADVVEHREIRNVPDDLCASKKRSAIERLDQNSQGPTSIMIQSSTETISSANIGDWSTTTKVVICCATGLIAVAGIIIAVYASKS